MIVFLPNNSIIDFKLKILRIIQKKYPKSHIGGSFGLLLNGLTLDRDITSCDLDVIMNDDSFKINDYDTLEMSIEHASDSEDFNRYILKVKSLYQIDISIQTRQTFNIINFEGYNYNVSKIKDILYHKKIYADKDVEKHKKDLVTILVYN